jgi:hypothetical protein
VPKFCRFDELGLVVIGQRLELDRAVVSCRVVKLDDGSDRWCQRCGSEDAPRE